MAIKKKSTSVKVDPCPIQADQSAIIIPLDSIIIDTEFNARFPGWEEDEEYVSLVESIKSCDGKLRTPIEVRPSSKEEIKKTGKQWFLVAGFRRTKALIQLGYKDVAARVFDESDLECRFRNLQENNGRQGLNPPDIAWALRQIQLRHGLEITQAELAQKTGLSQSYVGTLLSIVNRLEGKVFSYWRESPIQVSVAEMQKISSASSDLQMEKLKLAINAVDSSSGQKVRGRNAWLPNQKRAASDFGFRIGCLVKAGLVGRPETNPDNWDSDQVKLVASPSKIATEEEKIEIIRSFLAGVKAGVKGEE